MLIAVGVLALALGLRGMGVRIGQADLPTPGPTPRALPTAAPRPQPTSTWATVWVSPAVPPEVALPVAQWVTAHPDSHRMVADAGLARVTVGVQRPEKGEGTLISERIYVAAVPYLRPTLAGPTFAELQAQWQAPQADEERLLWVVEASARSAISALLGAPGDVAVEAVPAGQVAGRAWEAERAVAFLPFEHLSPRLSPLPLGGHSVLDPQDALEAYPLALRIWVSGPEALRAPLVAVLQEAGLPESNRDTQGLGRVAVAGGVALTRGVALGIERQGDPAYPARGIGPQLAAADVTHVSHEVSFSEECAPAAVMARFCARPAYIETLLALGCDLVEVSSSRTLDAGPEAALASLDLYADKGLQVVGGGRNAVEAGQPLTLEVKGTRVGWLAYNQAGPPEVWAGDDRPGTARFDLAQAVQDIASLRPQVDVLMVHVQHTDAYAARPTSRQRLDFLALAEAGADIVVGMQAHRPQGLEFRDGSLILYGLGNLIFDQVWSQPTRQSAVAWHTFYRGRHLATELRFTEVDEGGQPNWLEGEAAQALWTETLAASPGKAP
ncbi:MAG: CapA family protein [Chloroflexi bacterium]|nr:CapA family protein [Chloroflexota bacterium]